MNLTFISPNGEVIIIQKKGSELYFAKNVGNNPMMCTIDGLKLNPAGIVKEHPDLEGLPLGEMRKKAIERFKEHIRNLKSDEEVKDYLEQDLKMHGWKLIMYQRIGWRPQVVK